MLNEKHENSIPDGAEACPVCTVSTDDAPSPGAKKQGKPLAKILKYIAIGFVIGVVPGIIAGVFFLRSCDNSSPESMAVAYIDAVFGGDGEDVWDAANMDALCDLSVSEGVTDEADLPDVKAMWIERFNNTNKQIQDSCAERFGNDWTYKVSVLNVREFYDTELRSFESSINSEDSHLEVSDGVVVSVNVTISGNGDTDSLILTVDYYKINGEWITIGSTGEL